MLNNEIEINQFLKKNKKKLNPYYPLKLMTLVMNPKLIS
jgi:hypothetical protein